jgi:UDP-glucose 4-epimerase
MSRVLITGGTSALGIALARRLLRDPAYDVRVADDRAAPQWMRESCELRGGELRSERAARAALEGCSLIVHLAGGEQGGVEALPFTALERELSTTLAMIGAALALGAERFMLVSSARVFEQAEQFPTPEDYLPHCPAPASIAGLATLAGEHACRAAAAEHGLRFTICRPFDLYGGPVADPGADGACASELDGLLGELVRAAAAKREHSELVAAGEQTRTPTHVADAAEGLLLALDSPKALGQDFNLGGTQELSIAEILQIAWEACDGQPEGLAPKAPRAPQIAPQRSAPTSAKARRLLGWQARVAAPQGIAQSAREALAAAARGLLAAASSS